MIDKIHFSDNNTRTFIPYKGWIKENGKRNKLTMTDEKEEDSRIVVHELSHYNHHTTYNLKKKDGSLLLPKGGEKY